ncbi:hypothetical protein GF359_10140, partial [candidate division WOR-3 bacterium]|nr:hypothetical protein [candidate division WOR-3 bacterium]MBD3365560.1 hypothetical protein [candidate division WOR-3 bacterium]
YCCIDDSESPHSSQAVAVEESRPPSSEVEVGSFSNVIRTRFSLTQEKRVSITVFNASGRRIRNLTSGVYSAGTHQLRWPGIDDEGNTLPSGVYYMRLELEGEKPLIRKTVLLD